MMEKVDYIKIYRALVHCPSCTKEMLLRLRYTMPCEGKVVKCKHCGYTFLLGNER